MIFLGLCDISFNTLNGMYSISTAELLMNGFINVWCIGFGAYQAFVKAGWSAEESNLFT
jgi:hypothetical protein